jgi:hypothetical protein
MAEAIVPQERLLYASYSPPHHYEERDRQRAAHSDGALSGADRRWGNGIHHPRVLAGQGEYVLPLSQERRPLEPGGDKGGVVQGDRNAVAGLGLRGRGQRLLRGL